MSYNTKDVLHITNIIKLFDKNTGHRVYTSLKSARKINNGLLHGKTFNNLSAPPCGGEEGGGGVERLNLPSSHLERQSDTEEPAGSCIGIIPF
jgi:hypothetical protein